MFAQRKWCDNKMFCECELSDDDVLCFERRVEEERNKEKKKKKKKDYKSLY